MAVAVASSPLLWSLLRCSPPQAGDADLAVRDDLGTAAELWVVRRRHALPVPHDRRRRSLRCHLLHSAVSILTRPTFSPKNRWPSLDTRTSFRWAQMQRWHVPLSFAYVGWQERMPPHRTVKALSRNGCYGGAEVTAAGKA
uniref:Uncharacterized protein n=1 Tax=Oryza rufipogon TaxID=4529 RepID=A0A0E0NZ60_ORYRU